MLRELRLLVCWIVRAVPVEHYDRVRRREAELQNENVGLQHRINEALFALDASPDAASGR